MGAAAAAAQSLQSRLTLCDPIDGSPPGLTVPGILQARTLEWVAISRSSAWKWSRSVVSHSSGAHGLQPTRLLCPWDSPGKSTGVGCHCLLYALPYLLLKLINSTTLKHINNSESPSGVNNPLWKDSYWAFSRAQNNIILRFREGLGFSKEIMPFKWQGTALFPTCLSLQRRLLWS